MTDKKPEFYLCPEWDRTHLNSEYPRPQQPILCNDVIIGYRYDKDYRRFEETPEKVLAVGGDKEVQKLLDEWFKDKDNSRCQEYNYYKEYMAPRFRPEEWYMEYYNSIDKKDIDSHRKHSERCRRIRLEQIKSARVAIGLDSRGYYGQQG